MKRLGRGLAEIIDAGGEQKTTQSSNFVMLRTEQVRLGRFQPRAMINEQGLEELKASIRKSGVIEPIIVRPLAHGTYELVAGERRLRASQALGIAEVPVVIKNLTDKEALELSLIENIQRENLNPIEEAKGYVRLLDEFGYTQEDIGKAVGKDRATIANLLRLLDLPDEIRDGLARNLIAMGHARALLGVEDRTKQIEIYHQVAKEGLSVRQVEALAVTWTPGKRRRARRVDPELKAIEDGLRSVLGTKVNIIARKKGGRIVIEYFSPEDLTRVLHVLRVGG